MPRHETNGRETWHRAGSASDRLNVVTGRKARLAIPWPHRRTWVTKALRRDHYHPGAPSRTRRCGANRLRIDTLGIPLVALAPDNAGAGDVVTLGHVLDRTENIKHWCFVGFHLFHLPIFELDPRI